MREGKNNAVECFRVFFTMIIVLHHGGTFLKTRLVTHGYIAVEFFFILSGYLLVTTFLRESSHSCWKYLWKRYARLYPEYIMAAIVMIAFSCLSTDRFVVEKAIPELLMLQNIGVFAGGGYNYPCWYLPVMMIVSCLIYASLSTNYKAYIRLVAPLSIILGYTFINSYGKGFEYWGNVGLVAFPVVRGFAAMNIGVIISVIISSGFVVIPNIGYDITALLSGILIWIGLTTDYITDMILVLSIAGLLFVIASKKGVVFRVLNKSIWSNFGKYSYAIYLCHAVVLSGLVWLDIHFFKFGENQVALRSFVMVATVISYSILFYNVVQKLRKSLNIILYSRNKP